MWVCFIHIMSWRVINNRHNFHRLIAAPYVLLVWVYGRWLGVLLLNYRAGHFCSSLLIRKLFLLLIRICDNCGANFRICFAEVQKYICKCKCLTNLIQLLAYRKYSVVYLNVFFHICCPSPYYSESFNYTVVGYALLLGMCVQRVLFHL